MHTSQIKVLQILPDLNEGGVERGVVELNREFISRGLISHIISNGGQLTKKISADRGFHHKLDVSTKNPFTFLIRVLQLKQLIREIKPDIIHVRSRYPAWITWFANKDFNIPLVTTVHGMNSISKYSQIMTKGDKVICVSEVIQKYVLDAYKFDATKSVVIQRGVDMHLFDTKSISKIFTQEFIDQFGLDNRFIITSVGRISWIKDYETFIKAIALCRKQIPDLTGLIVGGARQDKLNYLESLKQLAANEGVADCIHFTGSQHNVTEIYALSNIVVNSTIKMGNIGRTIIEALAMNTPVIATSYEGLNNVINNGINGYLVKTQDVNELSERILLLHKKNIQETRSSIPHCFTLEHMVDSTIKVYKECLCLT